MAENIELMSLLGVGGMGDVWLATHIGLETTVAVKFMSATLANDGALIERFAREAKLASRIKSPHVVQIFDFATTHEGIPYIVMELIEGETLEARSAPVSRLGLEETSHILVQTCRGLSKAHEMGIIHRDMKPDNVLIGEVDGEPFVKILDFGLAKHINASKGATDAGTLMGTPSYMSPEQLFHPTEVDHRSDLWSLGVMTYLCLTGSLPFKAGSFGAMCLAIKQGIYPPASKVNPEIPRAMDAWFSKALAVPPAERFSSAKEMSDAYLLVLEEVGQLPPWVVRKDTVEGAPPSFAAGSGGVPASLIPPRRRARGRRRTAAVLVGASLLVAVGFLSRDGSLGRFVKVHLPTGWASLAYRRLSEPTIDKTSVETPKVIITNESPSPVAMMPVAIAPVVSATVAKPPPRPPIVQVAPVTPSVLRPVPAATASSPPIERSALEGGTTTLPREQVLVRPSSESETDPYSESDDPSEAPAPPPSSSPRSPFGPAPAL